MFDIIYIEHEVAAHPRTQALCNRFPHAQKIFIDRYAEVFNPKAQNFKVQKLNPALILAYKKDNFVLPVPASYGTGGDKHYYFSHMLNCVYDCRYCFLQGMYRSAHYLVFVNFESFAERIIQTIEEEPSKEQWFFSGYDCDSLAFEPITHFASEFVPLFANHLNARLELRTKSTQIRSLLDEPACDQVIVAYSLNPPSIAQALEHGAPSFEKRLEAMIALQQKGWQIGLRFDPLIWVQDFKDHYATMFKTIFEKLNAKKIHSVTLGVFRLPRHFYKNIVQIYPKEWLFSAGINQRTTSNMMSYEKKIEEEMLSFCQKQLLNNIPEEKLFMYSAESL